MSNVSRVGRLPRRTPLRCARSGPLVPTICAIDSAVHQRSGLSPILGGRVQGKKGPATESESSRCRFADPPTPTPWLTRRLPRAGGRPMLAIAHCRGRPHGRYDRRLTLTG
jgi:hypothetical protein